MKDNRSSPQTIRSASPSRLRCAVYTRKSTEEGLDQEFNSLDAQREACSAFITSQVGLGWKLVADRYDDGGISGGTMERPALQRLLQDIRDERVDVVVVYKIDRLTRSLADFAKIVEVFDTNGVSFVSVTQQFNTTTSMGRLTLNVLLSFAQFEREVTAERIRDKIAASRKKGMWMGGRVPFGYAVSDRKMVIDPDAALLVRRMFERLLDLGSLGALLTELKRQHPSGRVEVPMASSTDPSDPSARTNSGFFLMRGPLTYLLTNPIYDGQVRHHRELHDGEHEPILDRDLYDRVQQQLAVQRGVRGRQNRTKSRHLLTGLLYDETGDRLSPTSSTSHGQSYRYYISYRLKAEGRGSTNGWRLAAPDIESLVVRQVCNVLDDQKLVSEWLSDYGESADVPGGLQKANALAVQLPSVVSSEQGNRLAVILRRIIVTPTSVSLEFDIAALADLLGVKKGAVCSENGEQDGSWPTRTVELATRLHRRGMGTRIVIDGPSGGEADAGLVYMVAKANYLLTRLTDGSFTSIKDLAASLEMHRADISRILPLAFLSPSIVEQILAGSQPADLTSAKLARAIDIPASWSAQQSAILL